MKVSLLFAQADQPIVFQDGHEEPVEPNNQYG
jgi:hypothetical protein